MHIAYRTMLEKATPWAISEVKKADEWLNTSFNKTITHTVQSNWIKQAAEDLSLLKESRHGVSSVYLIFEFVGIKQRSQERNRLGGIVACGGNRSQVIHLYCSHAGG